MRLSAIDWAIFGTVYVALVAGAYLTTRYMRSVADFLAAGRTAGRYLLTIASGIAGLGAITVVANFEMGYEAGFAMSWWGLSMGLVVTVLAVTGWVNYRFRQTRALTLAEFFERRYSRRFRIFAGLIAFVAGAINFGIFPAVGAHFFIHFMGLPTDVHLLGLTVSTFPLVMVVLLGTALYFVFAGGQVAVMITDMAQGVYANLVFVALALFCLLTVRWEHVVEVLSQVPAGESKLNPFDTGYVKDFNFGYFLIGVVGVMYSAMSWQGTQAYNTSAKSAHEAKMGLVLGLWRGIPQGLVMLLVPIIAFTVMHHQEWGWVQEEVARGLGSIENEAVARQMRVPLVLSALLPRGLLGAFAALMLGAFISTHNTYLHSWGSIFIQDVLMPLRRKPLEPGQHLRVLRWAIAGVAVWIFLFSLLYQQSQAILLFFAITGAIFAGGSGAVIIGGLYWRRGTTEAAWVAMLAGSSIAVGGILLEQACRIFQESGVAFFGLLGWLDPGFVEFLAAGLQEHLPNGQQFWAGGMATALVTYVIVSLCYRPRIFNLDRLLHRGQYALPEEQQVQGETPAVGWRVLAMGREFSRRDRFLYILTYIWTALWTLLFIVGTIYVLTRGDLQEDRAHYDALWCRYWHIYLWIHLIVSLVVILWFTWGGFRDARAMLRDLASMERDPQDDGWVGEEPREDR